MAGKKLFLISLVMLGSILFIALGIRIPALHAPQSATWSKTHALSFVAENNHSGSGYRDLEGQTMSYNYTGFGSFELAFYDNKLKWRGFDFGYFDSVVSQVEPQVSKVTDDIYFLSWSTPGGTDNVVVNLQASTVFAHLWSGPDSVDEYSDFDQIHGQILCLPSKNCPFPEGAPTGTLGTVWAFMTNSWFYDLPSLSEFQAPRTDAHDAAIAELSNIEVRYETKDGPVSVQILGPQTHVSVDAGPSEAYRTHVTKVGDEIYFISWLGERTAGDHIVLDTNAMRVFDHISSEGQRGEEIAQLTCFARVEAC